MASAALYCQITPITQANATSMSVRNERKWAGQTNINAEEDPIIIQITNTCLFGATLLGIPGPRGGEPFMFMSQADELPQANQWPPMPPITPNTAAPMVAPNAVVV